MSGLRWWVAMTMCACGPTVATGDGDTTGGTTGDPTGDGGATTQAPSTSATTQAPSTMSTSGDPTGVATTVDPDTSDGDDDSCAFLGCEFDLGPAIECDIWEQDCPGGEKCMPWSNDGGPYWNATRCSPLVPVPLDVGEPCLVEGGYTSGIDDCGLGAICMFVDDDTNQGVCVAQCTGTADAPQCAARGVCSIDFDGVMAICTPWCDPLLQDCAQGACYASGDDAFACAPTIGDGATPGEVCDHPWDCAPGTLCIEGASVPGCRGEQCCAAWCDLNEPDACQGLSCVPWYDPARFPGIQEIGVCRSE